MTTAYRTAVGASLERDRLRHRARRIEKVLRELRAGEIRQGGGAGPPAALREAIATFTLELEKVRRATRLMHD